MLGCHEESEQENDEKWIFFFLFRDFLNFPFVVVIECILCSRKRVVGAFGWPRWWIRMVSWESEGGLCSFIWCCAFFASLSLKRQDNSRKYYLIKKVFSPFEIVYTVFMIFHVSNASQPTISPATGCLTDWQAGSWFDDVENCIFYSHFISPCSKDLIVCISIWGMRVGKWYFISCCFGDYFFYNYPNVLKVKVLVIKPLSILWLLSFFSKCIILFNVMNIPTQRLFNSPILSFFTLE